MQWLYIFWSNEEALGEQFKYVWVRVNPNAPMNLISDITNKKINSVIVTMS